MCTLHLFFISFCDIFLIMFNSMQSSFGEWYLTQETRLWPQFNLLHNLTWPNSVGSAWSLMVRMMISCAIYSLVVWPSWLVLAITAICLHLGQLEQDISSLGSIKYQVRFHSNSYIESECPVNYVYVYGIKKINGILLWYNV